jgi:hypothetical protein
VRLRLSRTAESRPFENVEDLFSQRRSEADEFYAALQKPGLSEELVFIQRQALSAMLWSKQFFISTSNNG